MAGQEYQVVFRGKIVPDTRIEDVKANLVRVFKANDAQIARLFSGKAMVLKKALERAEGERYCALLEKAGAVCELVPTPDATPPPQPAVSPETDAGGAAAPSVEDHRHPAEAQKLKPRMAAENDKARETPAGDLQQTLGAIKQKVTEIDTEKAGRTVASLVEGATTSINSDRVKSSVTALKQNKTTWAIAGIALIVLVALVVTFSGSSEPMPIESPVFTNFKNQYNREIRNMDLGSAGTMALITLARDVIEDMGYDYDRTLRFWLFHKDLVEANGGMAVYANILVDPVAIAVAADLSGIGEVITPATRQVFEKTADLPQGVDLRSIRMVKACPATGNLLKQADMLIVLEENAMTINDAQPDLTIADTFFGLERAGLIKIHRRWDNDTQYSDIEILDSETMDTLEGKLAYMEEMRKEYADR